MAKFSKHICIVPDTLSGARVDSGLAEIMEDLSRSTIQSLIRQGLVLIDDEQPRQKDKLYGGETAQILVPVVDQGDWQAQDLAVDVVFEDAAILLINKPSGLVVHPGAGNLDSTLLNALLYHWPDNRELARAGIVHRLDKDTSGLMVVAKTEAARLALVEQLVDHSLHREYFALCHGNVISGGTVDQAIARDPHDRRRMAINSKGKDAITRYRIAQRFRHHTLLSVQLETGRTHQIRVHMAHLGFPLVGDPVYGRRLSIAGDCHPQLEQQLRHFKRQALHATCLRLTHPQSGDQQQWQVPMPADMQDLIAACEQDKHV